MDYTLVLVLLGGGAFLTALGVYFFVNLKKQEKEQNLRKEQDSQ